jgi:glycosyltransferase involved in cell wall biosynthesis
MKLSVYTFVKDGLYYDFHVVHMLKHHLDLADEIVVNEGYSTDGTFEAIRDLSPKIRIIRNRWDRSDPKTWYIKFKNAARAECSGDWCVLLDADEFIPEWEFAPMRQYLPQTPHDIVSLRYINFFGNYRVYHANPARRNLCITKATIHRNRRDIVVWGDGANVRSEEGTAVLDRQRTFECHHFGAVCRPARLRQRWRTQYRMYHDERPHWSRLPGFVFDLLPYGWADDDMLRDLAIYEGPFIRPVREDPGEFVRDGLKLVGLIEKRRREDVLKS